jgi:hypothetical protein
LGRGNSEEENRSSNQRLEAYAVKLLKLEELQSGEPQPHVGAQEKLQGDPIARG